MDIVYLRIFMSICIFIRPWGS